MPTATPPDVSALLVGRRRILVAGGRLYRRGGGAPAAAAAVQQADPDLVHRLAAESNVSGTFQLLQAAIRFHHTSADEVFGSLGATGRFSETTPYDPRSPY